MCTVYLILTILGLATEQKHITNWRLDIVLLSTNVITEEHVTQQAQVYATVSKDGQTLIATQVP